jgi:hypothetical protein
MNDDKLGDIYSAEIVIVGWMSTSLVLLTASLLFYHMTRVASLEIHPVIAGAFATGLMGTALMVAIWALIEYKRRIDRLKKANPIVEDEKKMGNIVVALVSIVGFVELGIALSILIGTIRTMKTYKSSFFS